MEKKEKYILGIVGTIILILFAIFFTYYFFGNKKIENGDKLNQENQVIKKVEDKENIFEETKLLSKEEFFKLKKISTKEVFVEDYDATTKLLRESLDKEIKKYKSLKDIGNYQSLINLPDKVINQDKNKDLKKLKQMIEKQYKNKSITYKKKPKLIIGKDYIIQKRKKSVIPGKKDKNGNKVYKISYEVIINNIYVNGKGKANLHLGYKNKAYNITDIIGFFDSFSILQEKGISYIKTYISYNSNEDFIPEKLILEIIGDDFSKKENKRKIYYNILLPLYK